MNWRWQTQGQQDIIWPLTLHLTIRKFQSFHFPSACRTEKLSHQPIRHYSPNRTYQLRHGKHIFFQVLKKPCCELELFAITYFNQYSMTKKYLFSIKGMGKRWWKVDDIRFQVHKCSIWPRVIIYWRSSELLTIVLLGMYMSANKKAYLWITITHYAGALLNLVG